MSNFLYALKAPESKRQYPRRFKMFLDFLKLQGIIQEQAVEFMTRARQNPQGAQDNLIQFIAYQNKRVIRGEISPTTIPNYYRDTKMFCEMNANSVYYIWRQFKRNSLQYLVYL